MGNSNRLIAVISSSHFKWEPEIQYMESFPTRDEAILYASERGCNLIVKYERRSGPPFDVLQDPHMVSTAGGDCETVDAVRVSPKAGPARRGKSFLLGLFGLAKRAGAENASHHGNAMPAVHGHALVHTK